MELKDLAKVKIHTSSTFEGVMGVTILQEILNPDVEIEVNYSNAIDFREYRDFLDTDINIFLGVPYKGYALPQEFDIRFNVPFEDFIHIATFGETLQGDNITSIVEESLDPIEVLYNVLETTPESLILSNYVTLSDKAKQMAEATTAYRTWTWENNGMTRMLLSLYHSSHTLLPKLLQGKSVQEVVTNYAPIIKGQMTKMEDYIQRKLSIMQEDVTLINGEPVKIRVTQSDEYINEIANRMLEEETSIPIVACVARTTKGSDLISIRTKGVHAGNIAMILGGSGGKDSVASTFTGVQYTKLIKDSIVTAIDSHNKNE